MKRRKTPRRTPAPAAGLELDGWKLIEEIGTGGNGIVWRASMTGFPDRAIKILKRLDATSYARFKAEVEALSMAKGVAGVIPILDSRLRRRPKTVTLGLGEESANGAAQAAHLVRHRDRGVL